MDIHEDGAPVHMILLGDGTPSLPSTPFELRARAGYIPLSRFKIRPVIGLAFFLLVSLFLLGEVSGQSTGIRHDDLFGVDFPTDSQGWACGRWGTVLHTADGGRTWTRQDSGTRFTLTDICFVDADTGWAVGDGGTILHTRDSGQSWQTQESPVDYYHMGVCFVDRNHGWVASDRSHILFTADGGKSWSIQFSNNVYRLKSISFADRHHGWAVGEYGFVYHTSDGGLSWEHQAGFRGLNEETMEPEGDIFLFDVQALDSHRAVAVGIDSKIVATRDGGETWERLEPGIAGTHMMGVTADRSDALLVGGKGVCLRSTDGGSSWRSARFEPPIIYSWIYGIEPVGLSGFVAVGQSGAIYRSNGTGVFKQVVY